VVAVFKKRADIEFEDYFAGQFVCRIVCVLCALCACCVLCILCVQVCFPCCGMCCVCVCFVHFVCTGVSLIHCADIEFETYFTGMFACRVKFFVCVVFCARGAFYMCSHVFALRLKSRITSLASVPVMSCVLWNVLFVRVVFCACGVCIHVCMFLVVKLNSRITSLPSVFVMSCVLWCVLFVVCALCGVCFLCVSHFVVGAFGSCCVLCMWCVYMCVHVLALK